MSFFCLFNGFDSASEHDFVRRASSVDQFPLPLSYSLIGMGTPTSCRLISEARAVSSTNSRCVVFLFPTPNKPWARLADITAGDMSAWFKPYSVLTNFLSPMEGTAMHVDNSGFLGEIPFESVSRPKGAHLFRVYSMKNRRPFEFYYRTQLIEWARLEFDGHLINFAPVNNFFKTSDGRLFVAFKLEYLNYQTMVYIAESGREAVGEAFEKSCSAIGIACKRLGREVITDAKWEVWNRLKILALINRWKDEITEKNVKEFLFSLGSCSSSALSNFDQLDGFGEGRGLAIALEMVRIGKFHVPSLHEKMLANSTIVVCSSKGDSQ